MTDSEDLVGMVFANPIITNKQEAQHIPSQS